MSLLLDRHDYRVTACVHRRNTGRTSRTLLCCLSFFCDLSAARPRFVARLAPSDSPQSRGPYPRAGPPSLRPSRSASEVARSRLRGLPHAPYVFARTPVPIYCYLLLLLGLLPYLLPSDRLIIVRIQLPLHVQRIVSNNYTAIGSGIYITKTRCLLVYWPQYVHTYLQCYTLVLVVRAV